MTRMLTAVQTGSVGDFVAQSDPSSKTAMLRQMQVISDEIGSRLKQGYTATFWGKLNQGGLEVYVWKLEFKDGRDDYLVTLATKDRRVAGLWVH